MLRIICLAMASLLNAQTITTFAGTGAAASSGDGGPANQAAINGSVYAIVDGSGNILIADSLNNRVRRVDSNGTITTIVGTGVAGFSGDGGPATAAQLNMPLGLCLDPSGNLYINDVSNARIRRVDTSGTITTFAGNGSNSYGGDGGPAIQASFYIGIRCASDASGNIYVAEQGAHRVRRISAASGTVSTFAGTGEQTYSGDGGPATAAGLNNPTALYVDATGNLIVIDQFNQRIRRIGASGIINTIIGTGTAGYSGDGGSATSANINYPGAIVIDSNNDMYFVDSANNVVRKVSAATGTISTVAGSGVQGYGGDGGPALNAAFNTPFGLTLDVSGNLYVADIRNNRIREISGIAAPAAVPAPQIAPGGVTMSGSIVAAVTPGSLTRIVGQNLTSSNATLSASQFPLPVQLAGASVTMNGTAAPLLSASPGTLIVQAPFELGGSSAASVVVANAGGQSATVNVPVATAQPVLETFDGFEVAAFHSSTGGLVNVLSPAQSGEMITIYAYGLGAVTPAVPTGQASPGTPASATNAVASVTIGGLAAGVQSSNLAPGLIGTYVITVTVPAAPSGLADTILSSGGQSSSPLKLAIQ